MYVFHLILSNKHGHIGSWLKPVCEAGSLDKSNPVASLIQRSVFFQSSEPTTDNFLLI